MLLLSVHVTAYTQELTFDQLMRIGRQAIDDGDYPKAESYLRLALAKADAENSSETQMILVRADLAFLLVDVGCYSEAEKLLQRAVEMLRSQGNPDKRYLITVLITFGRLYRITQKYKEAEALLTEARRITDQESEPLLAASLLSNLGALYASTGQKKLARTRLEEAITIYEKQRNTDRINYARTLISLAALYIIDKKTDDAERVLLRVLMLLESSGRSGHAEASIALNNLGMLYSINKRLPEAESAFRRGLEIRRGLFRPDNLNVAIAAFNLADVLTVQGKYEEAEALYRESLGVREQQLGRRSFETALTLEHLAKLLRLKNEQDVKAIEARAKSIRREGELIRSIK